MIFRCLIIFRYIDYFRFDFRRRVSARRAAAPIVCAALLAHDAPWR